MRFAPLVLGVLCLAVLFCGLGRVGVIDEREARDLTVAREMLQHGRFLTPRLGGDVLFEKPTAGYAVAIAGTLLTPDHPIGARAVAAFLALALVLLTASIGGRHFGARAGWFAAGVLVTSLAVPLASRTDGTQLLASLFAWTGCAGLADALFGRAEGRGLRMVVTWSALAAAFMCGGPLSALWPLLGFALFLRLTGNRAGWRPVMPLAGIAVVAGVALPWYGALGALHGSDFAGHALVFPYAVEPRGPWYGGALRVMAFLVVGFFPWSTLLPGAALHAATWWRIVPRLRAGALARPADPRTDPLARERREESAAHFFIACLVAALVPLLFYGSAPLPAALAAMPAAALLCGRLLDHLVEDPRRVASAIGHASRMLALIGSAAAILVTLVAGRVRDVSPELRLVASLVFLTSWAPFLAHFMDRPRLAAALMALPIALATPTVALRLVPAMEDWLNTRVVAAAMNAASPPRAPLVLVDPPPPSLRYYLARNLVRGRPLAAALEEARAADGVSYVAFRPSREAVVARAAPGPLEILIRTPALVLARASF